MKEIIINKEKEKTIVAVLNNGELVEEYEESENTKVLEGNIYCGIVRNILPGLQSAFIDIGENKNAFIHIKDILPKISNETGNKEEKFEDYNISDYLKTNMPILVQVKKDEEQQKGARVSKHISMTGKYVVLMPDVEFVTVSQKIEDKSKREKLKTITAAILEKMKNKNQVYGAIVRTASQSASKQDIENDIISLVNTWNKILLKYDSLKDANKPIKICDAQNIISKVIIGVINNDDEYKIIVNTNELYNKIEKTIKNLVNKNIQLELNESDIFDSYNLKKQIEKISERKIWLNCGGFITIDKTEALTAIDVNSGKFVGTKHNTKNDTLYKVNKEATFEIAKQIRLRNISGIIIVDYIDMENDEDRESIIKLLNEKLKNDRSKTQVMGFTKLDLLEITRKRL